MWKLVQQEHTSQCSLSVDWKLSLCACIVYSAQTFHTSYRPDNWYRTSEKFEECSVFFLIYTIPNDMQDKQNKALIKLHKISTQVKTKQETAWTKGLVENYCNSEFSRYITRDLLFLSVGKKIYIHVYIPRAQLTFQFSLKIKMCLQLRMKV